MDPRDETKKKMDGEDFLAKLREASGLEDFDGRSDLTLRRGNSSKGADARPSLENIFGNDNETSSDHVKPGPGKSMDKGLPPLAHQRAVSWSKEVLENSDGVNIPPSLTQPSLKETLTIDQKVADAWLKRESRTLPLPRPRFDSTVSSESTRRLNLDQIANAAPFEQEAETHLLRAIEQHVEEEGRARADTASSNFTSVPSVVHDFEVDVPANNSRQDTSEKDSPISPINPIQEHEPLVERPLPVHRRSLSVEQTLQNLSSMMAVMHQGGTASGRLDSIPIDVENPVGSAGTFARNAALLAAAERRSQAVLPVVMEDGSDARTDENTAAGEELNTTSNANHASPVSTRFKQDEETWRNFFVLNQDTMKEYMKNVFFFLILPASGVAAILFYFVDNPPTGKLSEESISGASASWWLLFIFVRQVSTFSLALATQTILIDFLALRTRLLLRLSGPILTLMLVQSKGAPVVFFFWSIYDFALLYGDGKFAEHWAYWQNAVGLFNSNNPGGGVVNSSEYRKVLTIACSVSIVVGVKRFLVGLYLGRQTFRHYGKQLAKVMKKMLLVTEVSVLANSIEKSPSFFGSISMPVLHEMDLQGFSDAEDYDSQSASHSPRASGDGTPTQSSGDGQSELKGAAVSSDSRKLAELLERWEEPDREFHHHKENPNIAAVLSFRKALTFIQRKYPFSPSFGPAQTRHECIESAQRVYTQLTNGTGSGLRFETLARLANVSDQVINEEKAKALIKLFRPDRDGNLSMLDFVKSVDSVYKTFRLLDASIENANIIDRSFENIFDVFFYTIVASIVLSRVGVDPLAVFLSLSSIILAFAFAIGSAAAKYIEGVLLILVRRPYGIGDRISISNVDTDPSIHGSPGWLVEHMTLFETTVIYGATQERASIPNGSLANARIMNSARSPQAQFLLHFKVPIATSYSKIRLFQRAVEEYMKARPREWLSLNGFRANRFEADQGYSEYVIVVQHRQSWQEIGAILDSKANLSSYCQEVLIQLDVNYSAPPLPVDLRYTAGAPDLIDPSVGSSEVDNETRAREFRSMATNRHNIFLS